MTLAEELPGAVEIETFDRPNRETLSWKSGEGAWSFDSFLNEDHHRQYGRPWCIGRGYVDFLRERGVAAGHNVLDFGCGAGRVGVLLIPHLEPGRYFGVDRHLGSLEAFRQYEIPLHDLARFRPRLALTEKLQFARFGVRFDVILDLYVSQHMADPLAFYRAAVAVLNPGGRIFVPHVPKPHIELLARIGLRVAHTEERAVFLLDRRGDSPSPAGKQWTTATDHWHILERL